jgi:hypothetical protein
MCCGSNRQQLKRNYSRSPAPLQRPMASSVTASNHERAANSAPPPAEARTPVIFEYVGKTGLTVVSPTTGIRYRFDRPGAQLAADQRDQALLLYVPNLRPAKATSQI